MAHEHVAGTAVEAHPFGDLLRSYVEVPCSEAQFGRDGYLELIEPIVRCFRADQDARGAIVDRYTGRERYYSTPCYALGAALLATTGAEELAPSAEAALVHAAETLADGAAADGHPDFYPVFLLAADRLLADAADRSARQRWRAALRRVDPKSIYVRQLGAGPDPNNWSAINLTGEYLRHRAGYGGDPGWWEDHLPYHLRRFGDDGLYRDGPAGTTAHPFAYDAIARYTLGVLLDAGYDGAHAETLRRRLVAGALAALLVQSPTGEWLSAGRSSHHVWNEAGLAAAYEWAAATLLSEAPELAAACRRGAQLALETIRPWRRPDGALQIVRNRCEPEERHGYEPYSNHTNYNLWTVGALAFAYLLAEESIPTRPLPGEAMAYTVDLGADVHQVVVANRGLAIAVDTGGDLTTNPTGLVRIGRAGCNAQLGPSDGTVAAPRFTVLGCTGTLTHAPAWRDRVGDWHPLAGYGADLPDHRQPLRRIEPLLDGVAVTWQVASEGCRSVRAEYRVHPDRVEIRYEVAGPVTGLRAEIPLFVGDGADESVITAGEHEIVVRFAGSMETITSSSPLRLTDERYALRTGWLRRAYAESTSHQVELVVRLGAEHERFKLSPPGGGRALRSRPRACGTSAPCP